MRWDIVVLLELVLGLDVGVSINSYHNGIETIRLRE